METVEVCGTIINEEDIERVNSPVLKQALKTRLAIMKGTLNEEMGSCLCVPLAPGSNHPNFKAYRVKR